MMSLLTELWNLCDAFYKYVSPTDFAAFASSARQKIQTPFPVRPGLHACRDAATLSRRVQPEQAVAEIHDGLARRGQITAFHRRKAK
jgi:hypothetical protein